jgi:hypothetical protein
MCISQEQLPQRIRAPVSADQSPHDLAPRMCRATNSRRVAQPEVWFRVLHVAEDGHHRPLGDAYREQTVEVTLGQERAFRTDSPERALTRPGPPAGNVKKR